MKIISLNTYCGKMMEPLKEFLKRHHDVTIFCFQEVYHDAEGKDMVWKTDNSNFNCLNDLKALLPDYVAYYRPHLDDWWGLAIFIKKGISVVEEGDHFVHKYIGHDPKMEALGHTAKNVQFVTTTHNGRPLTVLNFHGLYNGKGKSDTDDRLSQSQKIIEFIKTIQNDFIFCGDFNLSPDTESLAMIQRELGCRELIKEYGITSTRTAIYSKPNKFADYVFVSPGTKVLDFQVLPDVVSDHAPLLIEI